MARERHMGDVGQRGVVAEPLLSPGGSDSTLAGGQAQCLTRGRAQVPRTQLPSLLPP